ncbi:PqqD family protein [Lacihabitans sp. LS3-19]|uniref:PqqD family protein n=1 Tax=Lacihabitans sp. LS3-19 TaxID=2487335 RepID=UPI0020CC9ED2|nr:PqqD family protein [Lacihabitans sp. LS3-19]MCP9770351.1 PqqD family protein [Lacihabitans sp. LS3-19]
MDLKKTRFKLSEQQISTTLSGESVILNHQKGEYYSLDAVGTSIWEMLKESPKNLEEIVGNILENFETNAVDASQDIQDLLLDMLNEKLVEIDS